ncbi:hypothetical protein [Luteolibacter sp. AS25]|uniref:hypothetical protein n=1 Tax=Luteolibacter sp. AS25 TaxID=3135776 RepID=UPI00398B311C
MSASNLEPVTPDPKKLRRTALVLFIIMIVGGIVILKAYEKRTKEGQQDDRPSLLTKISETKDLNYLKQDGVIGELMDLKGKVIVVQSLPQSQPDEMTVSVMRRLAEKYDGNEDFALVTLVLDPGPAAGLKAQLQDVAEKIGADLPQWTVASNERESLHKFIKNEFKANMLPHETEGEWLYDKSLVLIDKERHVRRAVVPQKRGGAAYVAAFDFEQAEEWDKEGIKTGNDLNNAEQMEVLLTDTIEILLNEEAKQ